MDSFIFVKGIFHPVPSWKLTYLLPAGTSFEPMIFLFFRWDISDRSVVEPGDLQVCFNGEVVKAQPIILNDDGTAWMLRIDHESPWMGFVRSKTSEHQATIPNLYTTASIASFFAHWSCYSAAFKDQFD